VLSLPRERPIVVSCPALFGRRRYAGVAAFGQTAEPQVEPCPLSEPLREIAPMRPGTIAIQSRLHEQPIETSRPGDDRP
jgi:hypothetical protein